MNIIQLFTYSGLLGCPSIPCYHFLHKGLMHFYYIYFYVSNDLCCFSKHYIFYNTFYCLYLGHKTPSVFICFPYSQKTYRILFFILMFVPIFSLIFYYIENILCTNDSFISPCPIIIPLSLSHFIALLRTS